MKRLALIIAGFAVVVAVASAQTGGQSAAPGDAPVRDDGAQLFRTWCASCHGLTAQGNGPLAPMMNRPVPDLTQIAAMNGGVFPTLRIRRTVDGRDVKAHGDSDMPIWGTAFKSTKDGYSEESVRARIEAVVRYLEAIQKRNAH